MNTTLFYDARIIQTSDFETDDWLEKKRKQKNLCLRIIFLIIY